MLASEFQDKLRHRAPKPTAKELDAAKRNDCCGGMIMVDEYA